jgi:hypothetical protein
MMAERPGDAREVAATEQIISESLLHEADIFASLRR